MDICWKHFLIFSGNRCFSISNISKKHIWEREIFLSWRMCSETMSALNWCITLWDASYLLLIASFPKEFITLYIKFLKNCHRTCTDVVIKNRIINEMLKKMLFCLKKSLDPLYFQIFHFKIVVLICPDFE